MRLTTAAAAALALAAGCGGSDDSNGGDGDDRAIRATVERLYAALADRDGAAACKLLAGALRSEYDRPPGRCERDVLTRAIGPAPPRGATIRRVEVDGASARAVAETSQGHGAAEQRVTHELRLVRGGGAWRVSDAREAGG